MIALYMYMDSPLMDEIEANLNDCQTDAQRERYLFSLLKPFGESPSGCGIARVYEPTAELNQLKEAIRNYEKKKAFYQTLPEDEQLKNVNGEPSGTPNELIEACNSMCKSYQEQIDWVLYVNKQFIDLTCTDKDEEGSVERCLSAFVGIMTMYANRLDALLLTYGIDLLRLQRESGLYLKDHRLITDVESYIGSLELAQRYIDALPKEPQPEQANDRETTDALSLNPEPQQAEQEQQGGTKQLKQLGRKRKALKDLIVPLNKDSIYSKLQSNMNGASPDVAMQILINNIKNGTILKPSYGAFCDAFSNVKIPEATYYDKLRKAEL